MLPHFPGSCEPLPVSKFLQRSNLSILLKRLSPLSFCQMYPIPCTTSLSCTAMTGNGTCGKDSPIVYKQVNPPSTCSLGQICGSTLLRKIPPQQKYLMMP